MRRLSVFLVCLLFLGMFAGCAPKQEEVDTMTPEMAQEIRQAYFDYRTGGEAEHVSVDDVWVVCIDIYRGAYVVYIGGLSTSYGWSEKRTIGGVSFLFTDEKCPAVYKDGAFFGLEKAYEEGILTQDDLKDLQEEYNKFGSIPYYYANIEIYRPDTFTFSGSTLVCSGCGYSSISLNAVRPETEIS